MHPKSDVSETFRRQWQKFLIFLIDFGFDALTSLVVFAAFLLFAWVVGLVRACGVGTEEQFKAYEVVHFWLNLPVFVCVGIALILRMMKAMFRD